MKTRVRLIGLIFLAALFLSSCGDRKEVRLEMAERLLEFETMEDPDNLSAAEASQTVERIMGQISRYEKKVADLIEAQTQLGIYYKMLGIKYRDYHMYHLALETFEVAWEYDPENSVILYNKGICQARLAVNSDSEAKKAALLEQARRNYTRSLELDPDYKDALYALSVLLFFEYGEEEAAKPLLERLISLNPKHFGALFMLANLAQMNGQTEKAIEYLETIEEYSQDAGEQEAARRNINQLISGELD